MSNVIDITEELKQNQLIDRIVAAKENLKYALELAIEGDNKIVEVTLKMISQNLIGK